MDIEFIYLVIHNAYTFFFVERTYKTGFNLKFMYKILLSILVMSSILLFFNLLIPVESLYRYKYL